jgi:hypothetical protein
LHFQALGEAIRTAHWNHPGIESDYDSIIEAATKENMKRSLARDLSEWEESYDFTEWVITNEFQKWMEGRD